MNRAREQFIIERIKRGEFKVDSLGQVWKVALFRNGVLRCKLNPPRLIKARTRQGYIVLGVGVGPRKKGKFFLIPAHHVVWVYFGGKIPKDKEINHKNGVKDDNRPSNLELVSRRENILHSMYVIRTKHFKMTPVKVRYARRMLHKGMTLKDIGKHFGVSATCIWYIKHRRTWEYA